MSLCSSSEAGRSLEPARQAGAPDAIKVDLKLYKVELENDRVRVVRISYGPNEKSVMHGHRAGIGVFLTDGWAYLPENLNEAPFEALYVELKR